MLSGFSPALAWFLAGMVMVFLEFMLPGVIIVFFGAGALLTALLAWLGLLPSLTAQAAFFCIVSPLLLFTLRRFLGRFFKGDVADSNTFFDPGEYTGRTARVVRRIEPGSPDGRIRLDGTDWKALADRVIEEGELVRVLEKRNITFTVEKAGTDRKDDGTCT